MILEAILSPPRDESDVPRFEAGVKAAMAAGATLARTVIIPGRRYEQFGNLEEFRDAEARGRRMLELAEPILARQRFRLAVENHKDQRTGERLDLLRHLSSEYIGACVDLGNSFALLEDFTETARAFAPWAMTVHIKDQAVRPYNEGFLYADVALGDGMIDLPALVNLLREARPGIRFHLETITRDALRVPVLSRDYWVTLADTPARDLARTWAVVMREAHPTPFVEVSGLDDAGQLALEDRHVTRSFAYARERLGL
jgi:sugar phosphate isomerase/epimerase